MVQRGRETSNTLFNELEQWEHYLKSENLNVHILANCGENEHKKEEVAESPPDKQKLQRLRSAPRLRGPS
jgi:ribose 1,5-bisphosphokinase PhnN